jgi:hypothetical protein
VDNDPISFQQPTSPRPPDRRELLWNQLERLHVQLGIEPPTATFIYVQCTPLFGGPPSPRVFPYLCSTLY